MANTNERRPCEDFDPFPEVCPICGATADQECKGEPQAIPTAVWSGSFTVMGISLRCYVLSDDQRVIHADDIGAVLKMVAECSAGHPVPEVDLTELQRFVRWRMGGDHG